MTVESNYEIAIAALSDWFKNLAPVYQPMRWKTKTTRDFSRGLSKLHVSNLHGIGRVRYINIKAWLRNFMVNFHGSIRFSLCHNSQGRFPNKRIFKFNHKAP